MLTIVFWLCVSWLAYAYVGYPLVASVLASLLKRWPSRSPDYLPRVTILTAARNEATDIRATIKNKLELNYPAELVDIIVVSDASSDGTDDVVRSFGSNVLLLRQEPHQGKTAALNLAVPHARGELLVFSDANSIYDRNALREIVANFSDPSVGYVTGKMVYANDDGSLIGDGCSAYMKYENFLRNAETGFGSVIGVDGGIDAVRRSLFVPMRADQLPDFVLPLSVVEAGYRVVYEPNALLFESSLSDKNDEYRMRVRVALRALWALCDKRDLLSPLSRPLLAWQIISHKVLRYFAFLPLFGLLATSLFLAMHGAAYAWISVLQLAGYSLAFAGWCGFGKTTGMLFSFPLYFVMLNAASAHAVLKFLAGRKQVVWTPRIG